MYYTLGQRQGLGIGGLQEAGDAPWYVVDKVAVDNALIVDQGSTELLLSDALIAKDVSWINGTPATLEDGLRCSCKVRYRQQDQDCRVLALADGSLRVEFDEPQRAVAPGQYAVFYAGERCLGGAVIDQIERRAAAVPRPLQAAKS